MSNSKPLPPFTFDLLRSLNRDQLERFAIVCRPLKNLIERYFHSKPYRVFDRLVIRGGSYALLHNSVQWHPHRGDYSVQQFLAGQRRYVTSTYYSFAEMRPYLGPSVRINWTIIFVDSTYNSEHIAEMESIAYLWRDGNIQIQYVRDNRIITKDFLLILNSPTILQCRTLYMHAPHFSFKDYNVLYTVQVIRFTYGDATHFEQFLERPGVKPVVFLDSINGPNVDNVDSVLGLLCKVT
ncbi:hypothetical protein DdX_21091 [Ditylenchus destructor]|uniref:F-box domain-containing protein n=1 Tax=Ditylenchus destructor TaxID=166010 RepID=A0AAD4MFJ2_9BILA|nr:hypothetical protein DdX_21091 [Ditylenchus destructor]